MVSIDDLNDAYKRINPYIVKTPIHISKALNKKFDSNIDYARVVLLKESRAEKVELIISSKKNRYVTKCYSSVFEKTLALAIDNIKIQIRKKRKI